MAKQADIQQRWTEHPSKGFDFVNWPDVKGMEPLTKEGYLDEVTSIEFLDKFYKFLRFYSARLVGRKDAHKGEVDGVTLSQMLFYMDKLLEIFSSTNQCVQLQAGKLLFTNKLSILKLVMDLSLNEMDTKDITNAVATTRGLLLLECAMLNCVLKFPLSEISEDDVQLLLSMLYKHLEDIPHLEDSQNMVKLIAIQSVLDTIYHLLNYSTTGPCILPRPSCVKCIMTVTTSGIQMLRILAKVILSRLFPFLTCINKQSMILDTIEIQSFLNYLQSQPTYNEVTTYPICHYMKDILVLDENRVAFLQWNTPALVLAFQKKHTDPGILELFDQLVSMMITPEVVVPLKKNTEIVVSDGEHVRSDPAELVIESAENFDNLTAMSLCPFDLFICAMKHFSRFAQEVLSASTGLTKFILNSLTILLGFIRDMMTLSQDIQDRIVAFFAENSVCLSSLHELVDHWHVLTDFPLFGNAVYGCLMTGSNDDKFCFQLGKSKFCFWMLSFLYVGIKNDFLQFGDIGHILGILIVIFNCAQRPQMLPALELVSTMTVLPLYAQCSNMRIKMLAKFALSFMDCALQDFCVLELNSEEIKYCKEQLAEAVAKGSTSHWYTHSEILRVLINLIRSNPKNLSLINQCANPVIDLIIKSMLSDKEEVQKESLKAFLNLHTLYKLFTDEQILQSNKHIAKLSQNEDSDVKDLALCAERLMKDVENADILGLIEHCYKSDLYDKCIELCSLSSVAASPQAVLSKAKCLYHLYRKEQEYLNRHYSTFNQQVANEKMNSCYTKTEECIKLLSTLLDSSEIDSEGSRILDQSLLDYIHRTNKLNKLKRCLLCRTKSDLKRSHLWPKSFLKRYHSHTSSSTSSRVFVSCASHLISPKEKAPGEITYWMLCGKCEQRLSQNGEDKFSTELFDVVCSSAEDDGDVHVSYGSWLYDFVIGMLFRGFIFFDLTSEFYPIFLHCRHHLLGLPVKYTQTKGKPAEGEPVPSQLAFESISDSFLSLFMLINPSNLDIKHPRKSMLTRALFDAGSVKLSHYSLSTGKRDFSAQNHFIVVRLANLNFILKLNGSVEYTPPLGSVVIPEGGKMFVPSEKNRWEYIPEALWVTIDDVAEMIEATTLRHYLYKVSSGTWKPSDSPEMRQLPSSLEVESDKEREMHTILKESSSTAYSSFISRFLHQAQPSLSFLPKGFTLIQKHPRTHEPYLQLPDSHAILCHLTSFLKEANFTQFLGAHYEYGTTKLYVIIVENIQGVQLAYGAYVESDQDQKFVINKPLIDINKISDHHKARFIHYCKIVESAFHLFLEINKVDNLELLIQRVNCTRLDHSLMSLLSVDSKCNKGCWYCEEKCYHCLQPAALGHSLRKVDGLIKFCKVNPCYVFYTSSPDNAPALILPLPHDAPRDSELLLQITKLIGTGWSSNTVLVIQLCINTKSFDEHKGELYVLMQFRTSMLQSFFDFFISKDFQPINVLWYMRKKQSVIMRNGTLFMLMLKLIIEESLQATTYQDLDGLLGAYQKACADPNDCQNETNKLEKESGDDDLSTIFQAN